MDVTLRSGKLFSVFKSVLSTVTVRQGGALELTEES